MTRPIYKVTATCRHHGTITVLRGKYWPAATVKRTVCKCGCQCPIDSIEEMHLT